MSIFLLAAIATCIAALATVIILVLHIIDMLRSRRKEQEKYDKLQPHHPPMTDSQHLQEQSQEQLQEKGEDD